MEASDVTQRIGFDLDSVSLAFHAMITDEQSWVHRRVEHISFLSHEQSKHELTVDFTLPDEVLGYLAVGDGQCIVPIAFFPKQRLVGFSLRQASQPVPLITRAENELIKWGVLQVAAYSALGRDPANPDRKLSESTTRFLWLAATRRFENAHDPTIEMLAKRPSGELREVLADSEAAWLIEKFMNEFPVTTFVKRTSDRQIAKLVMERTIGSYPFSIKQDAKMLFGGGIPFEFPVSHSTFGASYHVEMELPVDLVAHKAELVGWGMYGSEDWVYDSATNEERVALYTAQIDDTVENSVAIELKANRTGLPVFAALVATLNVAVLAATFFLMNYYESFRVGSGKEFSRGQGSVVLAVTAVLLGVISTRESHPLLARIYLVPRILLGLSLVTTLSVSLLVGFAPDPLGPIESSAWWASIGLSAAAALLLAAFAWNCLPTKKRH